MQFDLSAYNGPFGTFLESQDMMPELAEFGARM
jgi:hypothetical protein